MKIEKQIGWEGRLSQCIAENRNKPFDRGSHDCVRVVNDILFQIVGVDLGSRFTEKYSNDEQAKAVLREAGEDGFYAICDQVFKQAGWEQVSWKKAHRGDPCLFPSELDPWAGCLAICVGAVAVTPGPLGLGNLSMRKARAVWHIPYV